jgi:hypothetical protein
LEVNNTIGVPINPIAHPIPNVNKPRGPHIAHNVPAPLPLSTEFAATDPSLPFIT